ncbi:hypothetical protein [Variovorax ginsengisoli]|uniref:Uncharacterized protein n=1 Tax=Variovorax ginsengisoli TaxID=363844 RepID=A0ABT8S7A6_9BURK|nr:hypothetical protein [Variovorax ginsengisoli]MDN8615636.1 hypothetical protein [Variovorax ginsengisoli]MDO1534806.1 hypothetical protein [Variovorax ginsengisoli]
MAGSIAFAVLLSVALSNAHAGREELTIDDTANGLFKVDNKSLGLINIKAQNRTRNLKLNCEALSIRDGSDDKWMRLTLKTDPKLPGIDFTKTLGVDNASKIQTGDLTAVVPSNQRVEIRIDHVNNNSAAMELNCRVVLQ